MIVGLLGPAGSGKSTIAAHLADRYNAQRYALAEPLKTLVMRSFEFTHNQCWGSQEDKETIDSRYNVSPRWMLQRIGTQGIRSVFGQDVWIDMLLARISKEHPPLAVIEDCRFVHEAQKILDAGGHVWRLESPDRETVADQTHASEAEWSSAPYDYIIAPAARSIPDLLRLADEACKKFVIFPKQRDMAL